MDTSQQLTILNLPLLADWPHDLDDALSLGHIYGDDDEPSAYHALFETFDQAIGQGEANLEVQLQRLVLAAIEGDFAGALERAALVKETDLTPIGQVVFRRLLAGLSIEVGELEQANRHWAAASKTLALLGFVGGEGDQRQYLQRAIGMDQLHYPSMADGIENMAEQSRSLREIPALETNYYAGFAERMMLGCFVKEAAEVALLTEHTWRTSDAIGRAFYWLKRTLALAYWTGDWRYAREVRLHWVESILPLSVDRDLANITLSEAYAARDQGRLKAVLQRPGWPWALELAKPWGLQRLAIETRQPNGPWVQLNGRAADPALEEQARLRLAVIGALLPYWSEEEGRALTDELIGRAIGYLAGQVDPLVCSRNRREIEFLDILGKLIQAFGAGVQLLDLIEVLQQVPLESQFSFWELVAVHPWASSDRANDRAAAERLVAFFGQQSGGEWQAPWALAKIAAAFVEADPTLAQAAEALAIGFAPTVGQRRGASPGWFAFLNHPHAGVAPLLAGWVTAWLDALDVTDRYETALLRSLADLKKHYPAVLADPAVGDALNRLFERSAPIEVGAIEKGDVLYALSAVVTGLNHQVLAQLRRLASDRLPLTEAVAERDEDAFQPANAREARVMLLCLRNALGLPANAAELSLLWQALTVPTRPLWRSFGQAMWATESLYQLKQPAPAALAFFEDGLWLALWSQHQHQEPQIRARCAYFLLKWWDVWQEHPLAAAVKRWLEEVVNHDQREVTQVLSSWLNGATEAFGRSRPDAVFCQWLDQLAQPLADHPQRHVRQAVVKLRQKINEVKAE
jgi:hypothetical protein